MSDLESPKETSSQYDVFMSHAGYDGGQKSESSFLYETLVEKGNLKVFFDKESLEPGKRKAVPHIVYAMATAKVVVVLLSPEYICRKWCLRELEVALARAKDGKTFRKDKTVSEFLHSKFTLHELTETANVQDLDSLPAVVIPVFHSFSPSQCRDLEQTMKVFPEVLQYFAKWATSAPGFPQRWKRSLYEMTKCVGLEWIQRDVEWKTFCDRIRDSIFNELDVAMPGLDKSLKEKPRDFSINSNIPPVDSSWSTDLRTTELKVIVDYLCERRVEF